MASSQKVYLKQSSFAGGEVSPDMWGRDDFDKYAVSAKTMLNFFPHPFGGASNRPGTYFVSEVKDSTKKVRLLPFQFSVEQAYILEAGENYFRYYKDGGQIVSGTTPVETTSTYTESELFNLKTAQSADTMYICHSSHNPATLTRSSHTSWALSDFVYKYGPFRNQNVTTTKLTASGTTGAITVTASSDVFTSNMVGGMLQISHEVYGQNISFSGSAAHTSDSIKVHGDWSFMLTDPYDSIITIQISNDNGVTWENLKIFVGYENGSAITDSGNIDHYALLRVSSNASSTGGSYTLSATAFINDAYLTITGYTSPTSVTATVYTDANKYIWGVASTTATAYWSIGAWNNKYGYPACVKFYQNRLAFAGTTEDPITLWMSQIGDYPNFLVETPSVDGDAITAPLVSQGVNSIRSMVSLGNLLGFTAGGEWKIGTGSESTSLTPKTVRAVQQGYRGSSNLEPLIVGDKVLYCQDLGSTIRDFGFSLTDDAYVGDDLTILARHLFRNHKIVDWAFQQEPDGIIWAVRSDGVLLSFTYIKEQKVWAWARHTTDGTFESVASIPGTNHTEVYFVVKREINGVAKRYIERLAPRMKSAEPRDQFFVDCGLSLDNPMTITGATKANPVVITAASHGFANGDLVDIFDIVGMTELNGYRYKIANITTNTFELTNMDDETNIDGTSYTTYKSGGTARKAVITISGLNHLEGKTVPILADGSVDTPKVVTSGSITLTDYASRVHVGLGYTCDLETLNLDFPAKDGTIQGRTKRVSKVTVRVQDSSGGFVGINDSNNLALIEYDLGEIWAKPPSPLFTGDKKATPYSDWNTQATIFIRQTDPLPLTVLSIMPEIEMGGDNDL